MRHLYGIALAVGMTLVMFFGGAWGYLQLLKLPVPSGQASALPAGGGSLLSDSTALLALAILVVTAVLAGVLAVVPWFSPLASGLPGLLLLGWTGLYLVSVRRAVELIPLRSQAFGAGWEGLLFNGVLGAVGAVMVFPLFIPSRWRRSRRAEETDKLTRDMDDYLADVKPDGRPRQDQEEHQEERGRGAWQPAAAQRADRERDEQPLVGTVLSRPAGVRRVDTTRVTGASRALRATGSFRATTSSFRPAATPTPRDGEPRVTGTFRGATDSSLLGPPYPEADE